MKYQYYNTLSIGKLISKHTSKESKTNKKCTFKQERYIVRLIMSLGHSVYHQKKIRKLTRDQASELIVALSDIQLETGNKKENKGLIGEWAARSCTKKTKTILRKSVKKQSTT